VWVVGDREYTTASAVADVRAAVAVVAAATKNAMGLNVGAELRLAVEAGWLADRGGSRGGADGGGRDATWEEPLPHPEALTRRAVRSSFWVHFRPGEGPPRGHLTLAKTLSAAAAAHGGSLVPVAARVAARSAAAARRRARQAAAAAAVDALLAAAGLDAAAGGRPGVRAALAGLVSVKARVLADPVTSVAAVWAALSADARAVLDALVAKGVAWAAATCTDEVGLSPWRMWAVDAATAAAEVRAWEATQLPALKERFAALLPAPHAEGGGEGGARGGSVRGDGGGQRGRRLPAAGASGLASGR